MKSSSVSDGGGAEDATYTGSVRSNLTCLCKQLLCKYVAENTLMPEDPRAATDQENDRWCMAVRLLGRIETELDRVLQRRHGLALSDYRALCALVLTEDEGGLRMRELAERTGLKESSVTRLAARLERDGLTERVARGRDQRGVYATVTDVGRERCTDATPTYRTALGAELRDAAGNPYLAALVTWVRAAA